ncbi:hypothetical protein MetexDRAFT_1655 [Methylorubrum extorquens DSM 13060]|uniref:Uncharacterized protein n=1 Tax=Methylorubrum extorquens DSM 13060 TaxID=882800 RepID=H1KG93_METEX|nr:hypothetical protein MetexDRAFT_1655 [Methylorubrum extorquens DSM 13060]
MLGLSDWSWLPGVLSAGVTAALASAGVQAWRDRGKGRSSAAYLALRIAIALEAFAHDCSELIAENVLLKDIGGAAERPRYRTRLPPIAGFPDDGEGWRALNLHLAAECLGIRNAVSVTQSSIRWAVEYDGDIEDRVADAAIEHGLAAWATAGRLRAVYKLPPASYGLESVRHLQEEQKRRAEEVERRTARRAERETAR